MLNQVCLIGRLCAEPELKYTPSGKAVANLRLAVERDFKNPAGERECDFFNITVWGQGAEFVHNYLGKGRLVSVMGRLQLRQWTTPDGQKRQSVDVIADRINPLDYQRTDGEEGGSAQPDTSRPPVSGGATIPEAPDIPDPFADQ